MLRLERFDRVFSTDLMVIMFMMTSAHAGLDERQATPIACGVVEITEDARGIFKQAGGKSPQ